MILRSIDSCDPTYHPADLLLGYWQDFTLSVLTWCTTYSLTREALQSEKTAENNLFQREENRKTLVRKTKHNVYRKEDSKENITEEI